MRIGKHYALQLWDLELGVRERVIVEALPDKKSDNLHTLSCNWFFIWEAVRGIKFLYGITKEQSS